MGIARWYDETILPKVISLGCGSPEVDELRREVVPLAQGAVFELGCGGGFNQQHYDTLAVTSYAGIDPNGRLLEAARKRARDRGWEVDIREGRGEDLPFPDSAFDTIVCTYTLCSVDDPARVLSEMRRVLKPGGRILFLEHGKAPDSGPARWQQRIEPVWKHIAGNCRLTREVSGTIRKAGFEIEPIGQGYFEKAPKWAGWMEWGAAKHLGA
ncbi:class I SAM-dependent methyltransferase [Aurantiacibacter poecillastricola]|uniref:class I SAM-dependent methyltransferase n=1 Tax=Aurantiacibacter poecillastricola TaxID=3064385 RepID=UPI00273D71DB|nr:class I SAM-dependent methyltransferase [Aurantiacibacter sp. 219JJ12-13]MDP5262148.1 class I SAM-dependent methyltransferase [Aurantiacibacter sp. 219JJ12-13]